MGRFFSRNYAGQEAVAWYIQSAEREKTNKQTKKPANQG